MEDIMKKRGLIFVLIIGLMFIIPLSAKNYNRKRAITYSDLANVKWISGPVISNNNNYLAYTVKVLNKDKNSSSSYIGIFDLSKGINIKMTNGDSSDFSPSFSPDSKYIYFLSARSGKIALWRISLSGGEANKYLEIPTDITGYKISPDGRNIAFTAFASPKIRRYQGQIEFWKKDKKRKTTAYVSDRLMYRVWNYWRKGKYSTLFIYNSITGNIKQLTSGYYDTPPVDLGSSNDLEFSKNGKYLYFVMNREKKVASSTNNDIFRISVYGGNIVKITSNPANDNFPLFSQTGTLIAYRAMKRAGFEADKYDIMVKNLKTGKLENLTENFDRTVNTIRWAPDDKSIYFSVIKEGYHPIYKVRIDTGEKFPVLNKKFIKNFVLSKDGKFIFYTMEKINKPGELYVYNTESKKEIQLTNLNGALLSKLEMNPLEEYWFEGAGGDSVHLLLLKPPFFNSRKKYPVIELIHGGPQGFWGDDFHPRWNAQMFAARGYVVIMINFHGSKGYGQKFTDAVSKDWGGKPYLDIIKGTYYAMNKFKFINPARIGAAGASYGGYMIDWIEGHDHPFVALASHAGVYDLVSEYGATEELWFPEWEYAGTPWTNPKMYKKHSPSSYVMNFKTPCLVTAGERDYRVPYTQSLQFFTALQKMGVPSKLIVFPDECHFIQKPNNAEYWWNSVLNWFDKYLKRRGK
jgi:dipeptidyl aminopeptidase/acylaminoacyl peptidase